MAQPPAGFGWSPPIQGGGEWHARGLASETQCLLALSEERPRQKGVETPEGLCTRLPARRKGRDLPLIGCLPACAWANTWSQKGAQGCTSVRMGHPHAGVSTSRVVHKQEMVISCCGSVGSLWTICAVANCCGI